MRENFVHVSTAMVAALGRMGSEAGPLCGVSLHELTYPDFQCPNVTETECHLPFEECATTATGLEISRRRLVVPSVVLAMPPCAARDRLIQSVAWLYTTALLDFAYAGFKRLRNKRDDDFILSSEMHGAEVTRLMRRFDEAVALLVNDRHSASHIKAESGWANHLAKDLATAMHQAFNCLVRPTLVYFGTTHKGHQLRALNVRTEFTSAQWLEHLRLACHAALGDAAEFPPLPCLEGDAVGGYILRLDDPVAPASADLFSGHKPTEWHAPHLRGVKCLCTLQILSKCIGKAVRSFRSLVIYTARESQRGFFISPVYRVYVLPKVHPHAAGCALGMYPLINGGSGIRKDPAATYTAVRDPHPFPGSLLKMCIGGIMPTSNSNPSTVHCLRAGVKPLAYCHGFMAGLKHTLDDDLILHVLEPVFDSEGSRSEPYESAGAAAVFMRGLYDGVREYQRLTADPHLNRNWLTFVDAIDDLWISQSTTIHTPPQ